MSQARTKTLLGSQRGGVSNKQTQIIKKTRILVVGVGVWRMLGSKGEAENGKRL